MMGRVALGTLAMFVLSVVLCHVLNPALNPASHMISEYARHGPRDVVTAGFVFWAVSLVATGAVVWRSSVTRGAWRLIAILFGVAASGVAVLAAFRTQTSAGVVTFGAELSAGGRLHDLGAGIATLALFAGASLSIGPQAGMTACFRIAIAGTLVAVIVTCAALLHVGAEVGGLRQRLALLAGVAWQATVLWKSVVQRPTPSLALVHRRTHGLVASAKEECR